MENRTVLLGSSGSGIDPSFSFSNRTPEGDSQTAGNGEIGFDGGSDRRFAFSRQSSFRQAGAHTPISIISNDSTRPLLFRSDSSIRVPPWVYPQFGDESVGKEYGKTSFKGERSFPEKNSIVSRMLSVIQILRMGSRPMKRLLAMISLNAAYSTAELFFGIFTGKVGMNFELSMLIAFIHTL